MLSIKLIMGHPQASGD